VETNDPDMAIPNILLLLLLLLLLLSSSSSSLVQCSYSVPSSFLVLTSSGNAEHYTPFVTVEDADSSR